MDPALVVYDGACGMCHGFVRWLLRVDQHERHLVASSGSAAGHAALDRVGLLPEVADETLVLIVGGRALLRSEAVLGLVARLGGRWRFVSACAAAVPRRWRDQIYDAAAARRSRWGARRRQCRLPSPEEMARWRRVSAGPEEVARLLEASSLA